MRIIATDPKWRVICGGDYEDFEDQEKAIKYLMERLLIFTYASINKVYTFKRLENEP